MCSGGFFFYTPFVILEGDKMNHELYMREALELARKALFFVSPNPAVGAILVKNDRIIGKGFHKGPGTLHGEIDAIENCSVSVEGSTLYCTLEPCCTTYPGKHQPPCTDRIIREGVSKVVISALDPNPHVSGNGIKKLRAAGIEVITGILEKESVELNKIYWTNQIHKRPFIHLKTAQTLDGRIATSTGDSKWITNEKARKSVHKLRGQYDAILIGSNTLRKDDPHLTIRYDLPQKKIIRIIINRKMNLPLNSKAFQNQESYPTMLFTSSEIGNDNIQSLIAKRIEVYSLPLNDNKDLNVDTLLSTLFHMGINSILVEGGQQVISTFLKTGLYDQYSIYTAPKICGSGLNSCGDLGIKKMSDSIEFLKTEWEIIDNQMVFHGWRS